MSAGTTWQDKPWPGTRREIIAASCGAALAASHLVYEDSLLRVDVLRLHEVSGLIRADRNGAAVKGAQVLADLLERCTAEKLSASLALRVQPLLCSPRLQGCRDTCV